MISFRKSGSSPSTEKGEEGCNQELDLFSLSLA
jgi:hypothetical protein